MILAAAPGLRNRVAFFIRSGVVNRGLTSPVLGRRFFLLFLCKISNALSSSTLFAMAMIALDSVMPLSTPSEPKVVMQDRIVTAASLGGGRILKKGPYMQRSVSVAVFFSDNSAAST